MAMHSFDFHDLDGSRGTFNLSTAQIRALQGESLSRSAPSRSTELVRPGPHFAGESDGSVFVGSELSLYEAEADKNRSLSDWFRCVMKVLVPGIDLEVKRSCHEKLVRDAAQGGYGCPAIAARRSDGEPIYTRGMVETGGGPGGYTTPIAYQAQVFEVAAEESVLVSRATNVPLPARQVEYPVLNQYIVPKKGQAAWYGGVQIFRKGESTQRTEVDLSFRRLQFVANDLTAYTELSRDLVMDATIPIDAYVVRMIGEAIGWREDWEAFNGSGNGQFEGILASPALYSVTRHVVADQTAITAYPMGTPFLYSDITQMKARMIPRARDPVWFIHPLSIRFLEQLTDPAGHFIYFPYAYVGQGTPAPQGGGNYAGLSNQIGGGITQTPSGYLLGNPVFLSEKVPPPSATPQAVGHVYANANDLIYVDCKSYWVGRRSGLEVGLSEHFKFDSDQLAIRAKMRNDAKFAQATPITLTDGVNQVSGLVGLTAGVG